MSSSSAPIGGHARATLVAIAVLILSLSATQVHAQTWYRLYGNTGNNSGYSFAVEPLPDGGAILGGTDGAYYGHDVWVLRVDALGEVLWERRFDVGHDETIRDLDRTADGGMIVVASADQPPGGKDSWVIRLDASGNLLWSRYLEATNNFDRLYTIAETHDGGFIAGGSSNASASGNPWLVRFDADGNVIWERSLEAPSLYGMIHDLEPTADGGYYLGASLGGDYYVAKTDADVQLDCPTCWQKTYATGKFHDGSAIDVTLDGGVIVVGRSDPDGTNDDNDVWALRLDSAGGVVWSNRYGSGFNDHARAVRATADGGFAVAASYAPDFGRIDGWVLKLDSGGAVEWQWLYGNVSGALEFTYDIAELSSGHLIVGGHAWSTLPDEFYDVLGLRLDANGRIDDGCAWQHPVPAATNPAPVTATDASLAPVSLNRSWSDPAVTVSNVETRILELCAGLAPPPEPSAAASTTPLRIVAGDPDTIVVERVPGATAYNVFIDTLGSWYSPTLAEGSVCTITSWTDNDDGTVTLDVALPADSWAVVGASNAAGASSVGFDSFGSERTAVGSWPVCDPGP